jgi:hypothetical protein
MGIASIPLGTVSATVNIMALVVDALDDVDRTRDSAATALFTLMIPIGTTRTRIFPWKTNPVYPPGPDEFENVRLHTPGESGQTFTNTGTRFPLDKIVIRADDDPELADAFPTLHTEELLEETVVVTFPPTGRDDGMRDTAVVSAPLPATRVRTECTDCKDWTVSQAPPLAFWVTTSLSGTKPQEKFAAEELTSFNSTSFCEDVGSLTFPVATM